MGVPMLRWRSIGLRIGLVAAVAAAGIAGCATVLGIDSDRHVVAVDSGGGEVDAGPFANVPPNFACLRNPIPPAPTGNLEISWFFNNAGDITSTATGMNEGTPIAGLTIEGCATLNTFCTAPVVPEVTTDDAGVVLLTGIPPAFTGYYAINAAGFGANILALPPQYHDELLVQALAPTSLIASGGEFVGILQQPDRAFAVVAAFDCGTSSTGANPAGGISFSVPGDDVDGGPQIIYLQKNVPVPNKQANATDSVSGTAIIFNIPVPPEEAGVGTLPVTATFAGTGGMFQTATALVRQNWTTYLDMKPYQALWTTLDGSVGGLGDGGS
jgi:hypothetical protein